MKVKYEDLLKYALFISIAVFFVVVFLFRSYTMDDSYIGLRFSKNFADGHGLTWNPGDDPVQGYSNFLWTWLAGVFYMLNLDAVFWIKIVGILASLGSLYYMYKLGLFLYQDKNRALIPVILLCMTVSFGFWAVGGMEVNLFIMFMLMGLYYAFTEFETLPTIPISGIAFALSALTRHEGAVIFTITWFFMFFQIFKKKENKLHIDKKKFIYLFKMGLLFSTPYLGYLYWSKITYGYPLPAPFYGKKKAWEGIAAITHFAKSYWPVVSLALIGLLASYKSKKRWMYGCIASIAVIMMLLLVNRDTIMNVEYRLTLYVYVLLLMLCVPALKLIAFNLKKYPIGPILIILGFLFLMIMPVRPWSIGEAYDTHMRYTTNLVNVQGGIGLWINQTTPKNVTVATVDAGILFLNSERRAIDIWGLVDEYISQNGFDLGYFWSQHPDILVLFSVSPTQFITNYQQERMIVTDPYFQQNFEIIYIDTWKGQDYSQWVFVRKSLNLTSKKPAGKRP